MTLRAEIVPWREASERDVVSDEVMRYADGHGPTLGPTLGRAAPRVARDAAVGVLVELIAVDLVLDRRRLLCMGAATDDILNFSIGAINCCFASPSISVVPRMAS